MGIPTFVLASALRLDAACYKVLGLNQWFAPVILMNPKPLSEPESLVQT
jgi:hypothetical protein